MPTLQACARCGRVHDREQLVAHKTNHNIGGKAVESVSFDCPNCPGPFAFVTRDPASGKEIEISGALELNAQGQPIFGGS